VSEADALNYVLGYTVANDVSGRQWQIDGACSPPSSALRPSLLSPAPPRPAPPRVCT
jgi:hypothetical protein